MHKDRVDRIFRLLNIIMGVLALALMLTHYAQLYPR